LVAAVALIVVGPKDLPVLFRKLGQFVSKMRGLASEFRASFDELARQSELDELRKEVEALRMNQPLSAPSVAHEFEADFQNFQRSLEPQPLADEPVPPVKDPHEAYQPDAGAPAPEAAPKPKRTRKPKAAAAPAVAGGAAPKPKRVRKPKATTEQAG
jgi:sec-independent protein translocase protein TatB